MKTCPTALVLAATLFAALSLRAAEPTLADVQKNLATLQAQLEQIARQQREAAERTVPRNAFPDGRPGTDSKILSAKGRARLNEMSAYQARALLGVKGLDPDLVSQLRGGETTPEATKANPVLNQLGAKETAPKAPAKSPEEVKLRQSGIVIAQGFGVVFAAKGAEEASVGTLLARWNWLQRSAAGKWNRWVGEKASEADQLMPFRGSVEYWLEPEDRGGNAHRKYTVTRPPHRRDRTLPELTTFGPFFGTAIIGERVRFGSKEERPYLAGLSLGWGFGDEASSLVCIDVGATISPNSGFRHSRAFVGASFDGIVLGNLLGLTRKAGAQTGQ